MAYDDFKTVSSATQAFGLTTNERTNLFAQAGEVEISELLQRWLRDYAPLGLAINTEKSRAELIIAPILVEARRLTGERVSFFSGIEFNVAPEQGLAGYCDYIFSRSPEQLELMAPVVMIVEAKKENIVGGVGQCIAEMVAARIFNQRAGNEVRAVFGAVTTGNIWKFLKLEEQTVTIDSAEYYINEIGTVLAILRSILLIERPAHAMAA